MSRADYAHWNEEADQIWWAEEGRHTDEPSDPEWDREDDAMDAWAEGLADVSDDEVIRLACDADYRVRWPETTSILEGELEYRQIALYA